MVHFMLERSSSRNTKIGIIGDWPGGCDIADLALPNTPDPRTVLPATPSKKVFCVATMNGFRRFMANPL
jgi:hypothetical protein